MHFSAKTDAVVDGRRQLDETPEQPGENRSNEELPPDRLMSCRSVTASDVSNEAFITAVAVNAIN
ncbi:MAG: hypothetical protein WB565_08530 [Acidimicrobiales bacterium]